jgi:hypothetical protein
MNDSWHQMLFISPEGREEVLWVERQGRRNAYKVLNVPVWLYGVSVGSICEALDQTESRLRFARVLRESPGGTVRFIVPWGDVLASDVYLSRVIPDAKRLGLYIGPATFFNPRLVAVHVHDRRQWWPEVGGYFETLIEEGVLQHWEVGDPDEYAADHDPSSVEKVEPGSSILVHPLPVD